MGCGTVESFFISRARRTRVGQSFVDLTDFKRCYAVILSSVVSSSLTLICPPSYLGQWQAIAFSMSGTDCSLTIPSNSTSINVSRRHLSDPPS